MGFVLIHGIPHGRLLAQRGPRLDMWTPNPDKNLSTAERGVHAVAEKYAYDKQSEKFVFLQGAYQDFTETINKILKNTSREALSQNRRRANPPQSTTIPE